MRFFCQSREFGIPSVARLSAEKLPGRHLEKSSTKTAIWSWNWPPKFKNRPNWRSNDEFMEFGGFETAELKRIERRNIHFVGRRTHTDSNIHSPKKHHIPFHGTWTSQSITSCGHFQHFRVLNITFQGFNGNQPFFCDGKKRGRSSSKAPGFFRIQLKSWESRKAQLDAVLEVMDSDT